MAKNSKRRLPASARFSRVGGWAVGCASFAGMVAMVAMAWQKVKTGHGADIFRNFWQEEDNWFGFVVFLGVLVLAIAVGLVLRWRTRREWNELDRKYGVGRK